MLLPRADFGVRAIAMGGVERSAAAVVAGVGNDAARPVVGKTKPFVEAKSASATNSPLECDIASGRATSAFLAFSERTSGRSVGSAQPSAICAPRRCSRRQLGHLRVRARRTAAHSERLNRLFCESTSTTGA